VGGEGIEMPGLPGSAAGGTAVIMFVSKPLPTSGILIQELEL
jgi:hypothetical protein